MPAITTRGAAAARGFGWTGGGVVKGQQAYTTAGSYSWVAPVGVTKISAVVVGGGGGGANGAGHVTYNAGHGGGLSYINNVTVIPGNSYSVSVGDRGLRGGCGSATYGGNSSVCTSPVALAYGGRANAPTPACTGTGCAVYRGGIGSEGVGTIILYGACCCATMAYTGGGGGGAGGYSGNGGSGNAAPTACSGSGSGGAAGVIVAAAPPFSHCYRGGGGGGGVGILGKGTTGAARSANSGQGGAGGSAGCTAGNANQSGSAGALYGGGGGSGGNYYSCACPQSSYGIYSGADGIKGAVRIIWPGCARSFPSTRTANE